MSVICVCASVYVCMCMSMCVCMHVYEYVCMYACVWVCVRKDDIYIIELCMHASTSSQYVTIQSAVTQLHGFYINIINEVLLDYL